jgi:hypothetical protein
LGCIILAFGIGCAVLGILIISLLPSLARKGRIRGWFACAMLMIGAACFTIERGLDMLDSW